MLKTLQHIGMTRSGKPVEIPTYSGLYSENKISFPKICDVYTIKDHFDAFAIFEYLISREIRRGNYDEFKRGIYEVMSDYHRLKLTEEQLFAERSALTAPTIFHIVQHGKSLVDDIFVN